jgi:putative ABC transport system permease protein
MRSLRVWCIRFAGLFRGDRRDRELSDELGSHLQLQIEENLRAGMVLDQARRQALIKLGGIEQAKEKYRDLRGIPAAESLLRNVRLGLRTLRNDPGFTAIVVLTLALGIGANTAIFTVDYATLLAPLPYPQPGQLVYVWSRLHGHRDWVSAGDFSDWKRQSTVFADLNAGSTDNFNIATRDRPEFLDGMRVTPGYYGMLGNPLFLGRNFLSGEGDPGKEHVAILTHRLWQHLGANRKIIGQTMQINGEPHTVVGVFASGAADRWDWELIVPLVFTPGQLKDHDSRGWFVTGRLKPGVTIQQAQAEMDVIAAKEAKDYPRTNQGWGALVEPFKNDFLSSERRLTLWLLLGAVGFLLLIACLNVANLLLARSTTRQREVAIRASMGAKPAAIFAHFLTESLVLAILGGLIGVATGYAMLRGLVAAMPPDALPAEADLRLNVPVLLIMMAVAMLAGVLFGCAPAWYASRLDPAGALKDGGRAGIGVGSRRLRRVLVVAEFTLALPLLAGAGLTIHSLWNLMHLDLGVRTDHILGFYLDSVPLEKDQNQIKVNSYYRRILASIEAVPGVSRVSAMTYLPLDIFHFEMPFTIPGGPEYANPSLSPHADIQTVTPGYFDTFGIRIVRGRAFTDYDNTSSIRVAMVNEAFAGRFLKSIDPLQQRVVMKQVYAPGGTPGVEWRIVGVFHTVKSRGSREDNPEIDVPFWQMGPSVAGIGVRTAEDPAAMTRSIAAAVNAVDSQAALALTRTMEQVHDQVLANDRLTVILFAGFAVVALMLATLGIYGVMTFSVTQRSQEIALRMALGATRNGVVGLVVKEGMMLACAGLGLGLIGTWLVGRAMQSTLFGVGAIDLSDLGAAGSLLLFSAFAACYIPARRATKADPMAALRCE